MAKRGLLSVFVYIAGVIMAHLGIDLLHNALISTRSTLDILEYSAVVIVCIVVTLFGFVAGKEGYSLC